MLSPRFTLGQTLIVACAFGVPLALGTTSPPVSVFSVIALLGLCGAPLVAYPASSVGRWRRLTVPVLFTVSFVCVCLVVSPAAMSLVLMLAVGVGLYLLSRAPFRVRLATEALMIVGILAWSAYLWRPGFYDKQAARCDEQAARFEARAAAYELLAANAPPSADLASNAQLSNSLRARAQWFGRVASSLRGTGWDYGLLGGGAGRDPELPTDEELARQLGILRAIERHEQLGDVPIDKP